MKSIEVEQNPEKPTAGPRLENWTYAGSGLCGRIYNDPRFPDGEVVYTSRVMEQGEGWAQTRNTRYVLGNPFRGQS